MENGIFHMWWEDDIGSWSEVCFVLEESILIFEYILIEWVGKAIRYRLSFLVDIILTMVMYLNTHTIIMPEILYYTSTLQKLKVTIPHFTQNKNILNGNKKVN